MPGHERAGDELSGARGFAAHPAGHTLAPVPLRGMSTLLRPGASHGRPVGERHTAAAGRGDRGERSVGGAWRGRAEPRLVTIAQAAGRSRIAGRHAAHYSRVAAQLPTGVWGTSD